MPRQSILLLGDGPGWPERVAGWTDRFDVHRSASPEEARALLAGSRPWAAILIDGGHPAADRDLIALAERAGTFALVVDAPHVTVDWKALGARAALPRDFGPEHLVAALTGESPPASPTGAVHPLVAVTGPGGTGASTVAIALSQGLARTGTAVLLADFRRHAEMHVLHHLDADRPGIGDLVEAHRTSAPDRDTILRLATDIPGRGYRVLGGLRRAVGWASLRPRAVAAALQSLRTAYGVVVCDVDPDLEGEAEGGSFDVEERNALSRSAVGSASAVVVVGAPGVKGAHALLRVLGEMWAHGVEPRRTVPVVNRADAASLDGLVGALAGLGMTDVRPLGLPSAVTEGEILRGAVLPDPLILPITTAVLPLLQEPRPDSSDPPERITPGSLGLK